MNGTSSVCTVVRTLPNSETGREQEGTVRKVTLPWEQEGSTFINFKPLTQEPVGSTINNINPHPGG